MTLISRRLPTLGALLLLPALVVSGQIKATVDVDASKVLHPIPRTIFGTFLEPIGHSIYGGLWAQILENPSFEDNLWSAARISDMVKQRPELARASGMGLPLPWEPLDPSQGWRFEPRWGDAANSYRSLLLMALPGKQTGVRQQVYLPVHRVLRYTGTLWAKTESGPKDLEISLRRRDPAAVLARAVIHMNRPGWARYEFSLELEKAAVAPREPVDFVIAASDEARLLLDQVFLFPADQVDGMNPEMIAMAKALRTPVVRYGGNFTSGYHWRDGIGPIDKRVSMLNQSWGMPEYNHFGTDEFLRFCRLIHADPQVALNLGSGTPEEAAEWVRYIDSKWPGGGGRLWELGNELWGNFQIGYPTEPRVAARTLAFSSAIRKADPRARLIATGQDPDHFESWNAAQLANATAAFDYLSTHFVVRTQSVVKPDATPGFIARAALALPVGLERRLRMMKQQIDAGERTRGKVKIAFTEWLFASPDKQAPMFRNLGGALCTAGFLNTLMRVADFVTISDMTGLVEFGGIWQNHGVTYGVPAYWAFRLYSTANITRLVQSNVQVETYDVEQGVTRIPDIPGVPYLDVTAALNADGSRLTLFCVNRDVSRDIRTVVKLNGFQAATAKAQQLTAADLSSVNDDESPGAVIPTAVAVQASNGELRHSFPARSVTVIELAR